VVADKIAENAEFFSFGTNDLTQTTFGISRDDVKGFLNRYLALEIYSHDPFQRLDTEGVGQLMKIAVAKGQATRPDIKLGICGEHGGDPSSVKFCHSIGAQLRVLLALPRADSPGWRRPRPLSRKRPPRCWWWASTARRTGSARRAG